MAIIQSRRGGDPAYLRHRKSGLPLQITGRFASKARATDTQGRRFEADAVLDLLSPSVFQLELGRAVKLGSCLFVSVLLTPTPYATVALALKGVVWQMEERPDHTYSITVLLAQYRFL